MVADDPQAGIERRAAARHLLQRPLTCLEHDPDTFRLVRRHEAELDRWFTQRLGYRLHLEGETARLFKTTTVPEGRPLRTATDRPFTQLEYVLLALVLASTAAGPAIVSLRDLVDQVRSAAAEAGVALHGDAAERRALVSVLRWMIDAGLAAELHAQVDAYATDEAADAVLKLRPDRVALVPLPRLAGVQDAAALLAEGERRAATRQWLRARLVEEPVLYREDVDEAEWAELRRRLGEEGRLLDEMFGLVVEARAEGVAAVDPTGALAGRRFPTGGTVGHAALLLVGELADGEHDRVPFAEAVAVLARLAERHARRWSKDLVAAPERLARQVLDLLVELRLVDVGDDGGWVRLRPAAHRFRAVEAPPGEATGAGDGQGSLW